MRAKLLSREFILLILVVAHLLSFAAYYNRRFHAIGGIWQYLLPEEILVYVLGISLPLGIDLVLGFLSYSRRQLITFIVLAAVALQIEFLILDWTVGNLTSSWLRENSDRYPGLLLGRFIIPVFFVTVGALVGVLKRKYLLGRAN
jgi:hypothetical protein